jgi:hypothetical protein
MQSSSRSIVLWAASAALPRPVPDVCASKNGGAFQLDAAIELQQPASERWSSTTSRRRAIRSGSWCRRSAPRWLAVALLDNQAPHSPGKETMGDRSGSVGLYGCAASPDLVENGGDVGPADVGDWALAPGR